MPKLYDYLIILDIEARAGGKEFVSAQVRAIPGCIAQGDSVPHALQRLQDSFESYVRALESRNVTIPESDTPHISILGVAFQETEEPTRQLFAIA